MKYVPGLLAGQLSGKAGNTVASRNRNGSYFRTRTIPKLVQNVATEAVRASFTAASQAYRALREFQLKGWRALGENIVRSNSLGVSYNLTGQQAYVSVNRNLHTIGLPAVQDAPAPGAVASPVTVHFDVLAAGDEADTTVTVGAASATQEVGDTSLMAVGDTILFQTSQEESFVMSITDATHVVLTTSVTTVTGEDVTINPYGYADLTFTPDPIPAGVYFALYCTRPLSFGVERPKETDYKLLHAYAPGTTGVQHAQTYVQNAFGLVPNNTKMFAKLIAISTDGFQSSPVLTTAAPSRPI